MQYVDKRQKQIRVYFKERPEKMWYTIVRLVLTYDITEQTIKTFLALHDEVLKKNLMYLLGQPYE